MDKQFFNEAADTCGLAIDLIISLWPTNSTAYDTTVKEVLSKLNYLKDDMIEAAGRTL